MFYGATNTISGHPLVTVKTRMQVQKGHMATDGQKGPGYIETVRKIAAAEGPVGFYRGCVPPLLGSLLYRSIQFSVYEGFYTGAEDTDWMK